MLALVFIVHGGPHSTPHGVSLPKILASILATLILLFTQGRAHPEFHDISLCRSQTCD
jgi:hypothetical protein